MTDLRTGKSPTGVIAPVPIGAMPSYRIVRDVRIGTVGGAFREYREFVAPVSVRAFKERRGRSLAMSPLPCGSCGDRRPEDFLVRARVRLSGIASRAHSRVSL